MSSRAKRDEVAQNFDGSPSGNTTGRAGGGTRNGAENGQPWMHAAPGGVASSNVLVKQDWRSACQVGAQGRLIPNLANVLLALRSDPRLQGILSYDEMQKLTMVSRPMTGSGRAGILQALRPLSDQDVGSLQEYLQLAGLTRLQKDTVNQAVDMVAQEHGYHPVRDYLSGLVWDGEPRLENWLSSYLGAEASPYVAAVGRMFLVAMVARIFKPGCKADYVLVLEGPQGAGKSTVAAILGGPWFSDALPDIHMGKDAVGHLAGKWLIELGEMHALSKTETTQLKAFISRTTERYRRPFGLREVVEPRQCVFLGTTNQGTYLKDTTGGRRFWPVKTSVIDTTALSRDRDQLFAEVVDAYLHGEQWWPDAEFEHLYIKPQQEARLDTDPWEPHILEHMAKVQKATVGDIAMAVLQLETKHISRREQIRKRPAGAPTSSEVATVWRA